MNQGIAPTSIRDSLLRAHHLSVEAEAHLMNRGRGRQLLGLGTGVLLLVSAGILLVQHVGRGDAYARAAAASAQITRDHFNGFFGCALPDARSFELSAERVHTAFEKLGDLEGKAYASTLDKCMPQMQALIVSVHALQVPADVEPQRAVLVKAASALSTANTQYLRYLSDDRRAYDYVTAMPMLEKLGAAWAGYHAASLELQRELEQHS